MSQELDYALINSDYNNIHSASELQKIIHEFKSIIEHKIRHINELSQIHDKQEQERQIITRRMTQSNTKNQAKIQQYKNLIYTISEDYSRFTKEAEEDKEKQKKSIENMHQVEMLEISKRIEELQAEYKKVKECEDLEAEYVARIEGLKKEIVSKQYSHNDGMNQEEANQIKENQQLQQQLTQQINLTLKTAPSHAITKITTQLQTNEQQNTQLKQKLYQLQSELQKLKKQRNEIVNKRKELKINVTLNEEELEEYKAVGSLQKAKIKAYKDKLENMKIMISEEVAKKEKVLADHKKQRETSLKTTKLKLFNLQKQKQDLRIKTEKINLLGQTIMQQRTEIEEFFIMALDSCKKEIDNMEKGRPIRDQEKQQKTYGDKVDIDQLLPKDKQRILTNLYTKLAFGMK